MKQIKIDHIRAKLIALIGRHKSYKNFSRNKERAYPYTKLIGVRVCPYCNINYTYTVGKFIRPDLDHFSAQSTTQGLSKTMDVENLIPSCQPCNCRLKRNKVFDRSTHIHPFFDDFDSIKRIGVWLHSADYLNEENFEIRFFNRQGSLSSDNQRADANIRDFRLNERYQEHRNEVVSIFKKLKFYHLKKRTEISKLLGKDRVLFSLLLNDENCEINQTSLGKLKRDVIRQYK